MTTILKQLFKRFTPPMLRSDSPNRPMMVRRRHWLLQETRFLFLTRKGPVEIILKPSLILGAGFVGVVGMTVIGAVTLFVGFKSVEVVRNESITAAIASAPPAIDIQQDGITTPSLAEAQLTEDADRERPALETASAIASVPRLPELLLAIDALPAITLPDWSREPAERRPASRDPALASSSASPENIISGPDLPFMESGISEPLAEVELGAEPVLEVVDVRDPLLFLPEGEVETISMDSPPAMPDELQAGLEPLHREANLPVVTMASRQYKLLRSMAREVRGIRESLLELGISEDSMPGTVELSELVEAADFANLAMAVEDHRSLLRKIPLKPPMLYFYITSNYGMRKHPVLKKRMFHHGIDLAGTWQEEIQTSAPGTVIFAGREGSFGKVVKVRHAYGIVTTYAHLAKITVRKGADVVAGSVVGKMGRTGRVDGAHLHYEIRIDGKSLDPKRFFSIGHRIGVGGELMMATDQP